MLDELIREALQEAAACCVLPDADFDRIWSRITAEEEDGQPGSGGETNG